MDTVESSITRSGESPTTFGMGGGRQQLFQDCKQVEYESINSPSDSQRCSNQFTYETFNHEPITPYWSSSKSTELSRA